jgi:hypothetical protein
MVEGAGRDFCAPIIGDPVVVALAPRVGDGGGSLEPASARPLGVQLPALSISVGVPAGGFVGDCVGVVVRTVDGEAGDSGRRKGDARGEPRERGEGLYADDMDCSKFVALASWGQDCGCGMPFWSLRLPCLHGQSAFNGEARQQE